MNCSSDQAITYLTALTAALNETGLQATLLAGGEAPQVQVINPELISSNPSRPGPALIEYIGIVHRETVPEWLLCWSWGDALAAADDIPAAVQALTRVLTLAPAATTV